MFLLLHTNCISNISTIYSIYVSGFLNKSNFLNVYCDLQQRNVEFVSWFGDISSGLNPFNVAFRKYKPFSFFYFIKNEVLFKALFMEAFKCPPHDNLKRAKKLKDSMYLKNDSDCKCAAS